MAKVTSPNGRTADQQIRTNLNLDKPIAHSDFDFSGSFLIDTASSINSTSPRSYSGSYALSPGLTYKPDEISFNVRAAYNREYSYVDDHGKSGDFDNLGYSLMKSVKKPVWFLDTFSFGVGGALPVGDEARRQTFKGSYGPRLEIDRKVGPFVFTDTLLYAYRVYGYNIRDDGTVNSPHSYADTVSATLNVTKDLQFAAEFTYQYTISFEKVAKGYYSDSFSMGYNFNESVNASVGVGTVNHEMLEADGMSYRVKPIDPETSQMFFDLTMKI